MKHGLLVDFDDSFTYNIAAEAYQVGLQLDVIHWRKLTSSIACEFIVLGPGPGHPQEYQLQEEISGWVSDGKKLAGICLGHQLLCQAIGFSIRTSENIVHGQRVSLPIPQSWQKRLAIGRHRIWVQRYNSLAVTGKTALKADLWWQGDELMALASDKIVSYQFHPESVGTNCPAPFFRQLLQLAL